MPPRAQLTWWLGLGAAILYGVALLAGVAGGTAWAYGDTIPLLVVGFAGGVLGLAAVIVGATAARQAGTFARRGRVGLALGALVVVVIVVFYTSLGR